MNKKDRAAFTFIELLIAVTIFSIIAVSVYSVFNAGIRVWLRTNPIVEGNQAMRILFNTASLDLKNAVAYTNTGTNFKGEPKKISFMTLIDVAGDKTPLHTELARVVYCFDKDTKAIKRLVAAKDEGLDETKARGQEFLRDTKEEDLGFEYCYEETYSGTEFAYKWKDTWQDEAKIPRGVRIKLGEFRKAIFIPTGELGVEK